MGTSKGSGRVKTRTKKTLGQKAKRRKVVAHNKIVRAKAGVRERASFSPDSLQAQGRPRVGHKAYEVDARGTVRLKGAT